MLPCATHTCHEHGKLDPPNHSVAVDRQVLCVPVTNSDEDSVITTAHRANLKSIEACQSLIWLWSHHSMTQH